MYRIVLVNVPFASAYRPSIALTQLKSVIEKNFSTTIAVNIVYLNQEFARHMGVVVYQDIADGGHSNTGVGDWIFRQAAFPELANNATQYFQRYYPGQDTQTLQFIQMLQTLRHDIDGYLDTMIARYRLDQAEIVGFTSMFSQNMACFALARKIKKLNPSACIVMGGANCEMPMGREIVKQVNDIDFVFSGPGLESFPRFVYYCLYDERERCHSINGVFSKRNCQNDYWSAEVNGVIPLRKSASKDSGDELSINTQVELDYDDFLDNYERNFPDKEIAPSLMFETSRGCWWGERSHCTFCGLNGSMIEYRAMEPVKAIEYIKTLFKYTPRCVYFESVDNILPQRYVKEVLPFLEAPPNVAIFYEVKASLSESDIQTIARANVRFIQPGIESLATSTLKLMKKGTTVFQNLLLLSYCLTYDVFPVWNLLVGFPGEDEEVYRKYVQDIPLLTHLPPPNGVFPVRFDRYSPYFVQQEHFGLDLHPYDFYQLTYPFDKKSVAELAYYFSDHNFGAEYAVKIARWIGQLKNKFSFWEKLWYESAPEHLPGLFFKAGESDSVVFDSRSGEVVEHRLTDIGRQILQHFSRPGRVVDLASSLSHVPQHALVEEMHLLQQKGLLFHEAEKCMSLVLPEKPQSMESFYQIRKKMLK